MSGLCSRIPVRGLNPHRSDALGRQISMHIAAVDMVSRQIAIAVRRPGEIDGAGSRIGHGDQPLGNRGGKTSVVATTIASLGKPCTSTDCPESSNGRDPFERVAISLVEEGGGIDRVARISAVLPMDHERLCGSGHGRGERRLGSLLGRWGVQLQTLDAEGHRSPGLGDRLPAEQDAVLPHLPSQSGDGGWS